MERAPSAGCDGCAKSFPSLVPASSMRAAPLGRRFLSRQGCANIAGGQLFPEHVAILTNCNCPDRAFAAPLRGARGWGLGTARGRWLGGHAYLLVSGDEPRERPTAGGRTGGCGPQSLVQST